MELQPWKLLSWGVLLQFQQGVLVHVALFFLLSDMALENAGIRRTLHNFWHRDFHSGKLRNICQTFMIWWSSIDTLVLELRSGTNVVLYRNEPAHVSKFSWKGEEEKKGRIWPIIAVILTKLLKCSTLLATPLDWAIVHSDLEIKPQELRWSSAETLRANCCSQAVDWERSRCKDISTTFFYSIYSRVPLGLLG